MTGIIISLFMSKRKIIVAIIALGFISFLAISLLKSRAKMPVSPPPLPSPTAIPILEDGVAIEPEAQSLVTQAKDDLAQKLDVKKEEIKLTEIEPIDWPDTSLGCSQPGMFYAQVITPGYQITLDGRGQSYLYHSDYKRVVFCQR